MVLGICEQKKNKHGLRDNPNCWTQKTTQSPAMSDLVARVYRKQLRSAAVLYGQQPMLNSQYGIALAMAAERCKNQEDKEGRCFMFATLFSGGRFIVPHHEYISCLQKYAHDVKNGVHMTVNEISNNTVGIKAFFELDYRFESMIPSDDTVFKHCRMAQDLMQQCFHAGTDCYMCVAKCQHKIKNTSKGKVVAAGVHVVFPHINLTTCMLRKLMLCLDARITKDDPTYSGVVDVASVRKSVASLRMIYSHKMDTCGDCRYRFSLDYSKQQENQALPTTTLPTNDEWMLDEQKFYSLQQNRPPVDLIAAEEERSVSNDVRYIVPCATCRQMGKVLAPSVYVPSMAVDSSNNVVSSSAFMAMGVQEHVAMFSIVPTEIAKFTPLARTMPSDMPDTGDVIPREDEISFKGERRIVNCQKKAKNTDTMLRREYPQLYAVVQEMVQSSWPQYVHTIVDSVTLRTLGNRKRVTLFVNVKGKNARHCLYKGDAHRSNRIYFHLDLFNRVMKLACYDGECRKNNNTTHEKPISLEIRRQLLCSLGVPTSCGDRLQQQCTISKPLLATCEAPKVQPAVQKLADKTEMQNKYLQLLASFQKDLSKKT